MTNRDVLEVDVIIIGAGPASLSAACKLKQLNSDLNICVLEKGASVGAHILSGAVIEPHALNELFPNWCELNAPLTTKVTKDEVYLLISKQKGIKVPNFLVPKTLHNQGNFIASLGDLCIWLSEQAENLGVDIFPGFAAASLIYGQNNEVLGVITGDMGLDKNSQPKSTFAPGMEIRAKYTIVAEGSRGHLGKELINKFKLATSLQHYGLGIKELWQVPPNKQQSGLVVHTSGFPLNRSNPGGGFLYHLDDNLVATGLIVDLSYRNPHLSPFDEFQRFKQHPIISKHLKDGTRLAYGARSLTKGGFNALPKFGVPGALIIGCDFGTLNCAKIKGVHCAMKSGMLAAEAIAKAINQNRAFDVLSEYEELFKASWLYQELYAARNFNAAMHKFGPLLGPAFSFVEHNLCRSKLPLTLHDGRLDHTLQKASDAPKINYAKADGVLSFDKTSSLFLANLDHDENQPCHLVLADQNLPITHNLPNFDEPAQRYCPAGVYEIVNIDDEPKLHINAQNCLHCKTCDIKDPSQNISWTPPEGGSGPNYSNM